MKKSLNPNIIFNCDHTYVRKYVIGYIETRCSKCHCQEHEIDVIKDRYPIEYREYKFSKLE